MAHVAEGININKIKKISVLMYPDIIQNVQNLLISSKHTYTCTKVTHLTKTYFYYTHAK